MEKFYLSLSNIRVLWGALFTLDFLLLAFDFEFLIFLLTPILVLLPVAISYLKIKPDLYNLQKRILYKLPLDSTKIAFISSSIVVGIGVLFDVDLNGAPFPLLFAWLFLLGPAYLLITFSIGFLISIIIYIKLKFTKTPMPYEAINAVGNGTDETHKENRMAKYFSIWSF